MLLKFDEIKVVSHAVQYFKHYEISDTRGETTYYLKLFLFGGSFLEFKTHDKEQFSEWLKNLEESMRF